MFQIERFIDECQAAVKESDALNAMNELVARVVSEPAQVLRALGEPERSGVQTIYKANNLTILNVCWGPRMEMHPHDHRMWAVIGIYTGREDNIYWRRLPQDSDRQIEAAGARSLCRGDCTPMGSDIIHSVTNPISRLTGAIHVYGGDFLKQERSEWDPETLHERAYDVAKARQLFENSNRALVHA